tara:strand:- start:4716 stop:4991 length:276 start_codon:yes stop_codon:yes gene_type:complete
MELPKISNKNLPKELREVLGDQDAYFDPIVDPRDVLDIQHDPDAYYEDRHRVQHMLVESRQKLNEYITKERHETKRNNQSSKANNQSTQEK